MSTLRQELAAKEIVANGGNVTKAMLAVGYSVATAETPGKLTKSRGFNELIEKYLPERHLLAKHRTFLDSKRIIKTFRKGDLQETIEETDPNAVKALDMAYKLRGKYKGDVTNNVLVINVSEQASGRYKPVDPVHVDATGVSGDTPPTT